MRVVGLHFVDRGWRIVDISWAVAEFSCADVCIHEVLHRVPQAGQHHGGRRAVNLHEYAAVAAAENIFQVGANIFKHILSYFMLSRLVLALPVRGLVTANS